MKLKIRRLAAIVLCFGFASVSARAQEESPVDSGGPYVISRVDFIVTGITVEYILRNKADIKIGTSFRTKEALERFLADRRQLLLNERVLASVEASYEATAAPSGGYDVVVSFATVDSWNLIALPAPPQFDSNTGLKLAVKARHYNFLGSMQTLSLNLTYTVDETGRSGFGGETSFSIPFRAFSREWSLGIDQDLNIYPDGTPATSVSSVSLGITFREPGFPVTLTGKQSLSFNPEGIASDPDPYFLTNAVSLSASIPTGIRTGVFDEVYYNPTLSLSHNWRFSGHLQYEHREGTTPYFFQSLTFGRADWEGNLRRGVAFSLSNVVSYNAYESVLTTYIDSSVRCYANLLERFGLAARGQAFCRLSGDERTDQGGYLRGILDGRIDCETAIFANVDLPTKLFDFPTHMIIGKEWLDFELQASPFIDVCLAKRKGYPVSSEDFWYSGGLEFLVFPKLMRTFIIRGSVGFDLDAAIKNGSLFAPSPRDGASPYEIYFGMGLHY